MKRFASILVVLMLASHAWAAKRVTVDQLEQIINASQGKPDAEVAGHLSELELTERLNSTLLARWKASLPGEKVQAALVALADASEFLDPPDEEIPGNDPPDLATQRKMMALTVNYVSKTIPLLPNILATRVTSRFEDTPLQQHLNSPTTLYQPLHSVGNSSVTVTYRHGQEAVDAGAAKDKKANGLTTWGVFGPILGTVLEDAARSKLVWSHWEEGESDLVAVFSYSVPKEKSHYRVDYCCVPIQSPGGVANLSPFSQIVAYHGEMTVDPASGTILRLMVEAELNTNDPVARASIVVEYGPVEIGGKTYICPLKSVALSLAQSSKIVEDTPLHTSPVMGLTESYEPSQILSVAQGPPQIKLNDVAFEQYHLFRTEARVVTGDAAETEPAKPENAPSVVAKTAEAAAAQPASPAAPMASAAPTAAPVAGTGAVPVSLSTSVPEQEIAEAEASGVPDAPANPSMPQPSGFTLKVASRLVDIGVVAYDKKGYPVKDLKPEDFEIYDNGRKQQVRYFSQAAEEVSAAAPGSSVAAPAQPEISNHGASDAKNEGGEPESSSTILLVDVGNISYSDLSYARAQTMRFLRALPAGERVGLYVMKRVSFQILAEETTDHALLEEKLSRWMPSAQDLQNAQDEERRNRQQFETVHSIEDLLYVNGSASNDSDGHRQNLDPALRDWGSNPARDAMIILEGVAWHLAAISGHKNLVWISSDNALVDWSNKAASIEKNDKYIDPNTLRAQEAMNDAHVSVYPLDVSQLEGGMVDASVSRFNVELAEVTPIQQQMSRLGPEATAGIDIDMFDNGGHILRPGRLISQMQQDTRAIQGPIRHLAEATGGRIFRRSDSIATELNGVIEEGHAAYLLSFTPDLPADGQFHLLTLKLASKRPGLTLHYRTGYIYSKEPATLKERFHQALWLPVDANQVAVTAQPITFEGGLRVKITVAAGDLALEEKSGRWSGNLDVFLVQRDDAGLQAQVEGKRLGLQLKASTLQYLLKNGLSVERTVQLKPSITSLRVLIVDENTGRMGSVTIPSSALQAGHSG
jgi:VWFA-related protein